MPIWPFKKRRRDSVALQTDTRAQPLLSEKPAPPSALPTPPDDAPLPSPSYPSRRTSSPIPIPRKSSKRGRTRALEDSEKLAESYGKENVAPGPIAIPSQDAITALPMTYKLQYSPHLRPVDLDRPHIPYDFRPYSGSQTSVQPDPSPSSGKLRKKRSSYDSGTPQRHRSTRSRKDEQLREEEIRAMSAHSPIPKRPGEGPLRRDSKKMRSGMKDSLVSLPAHEGSVHGSLPSIMEQRGWEIGAFSIFNPRPAVRLSGLPQYIAPGSLPGSPPPELARRAKDKMPASRDSAKKRDTIGSRADVLDASDIRLVMERDAKRREKRKQDQADALDRKLQKEGRKRRDSDRRRREAGDEGRARDIRTPPTDIHPALRDQPSRHGEEEAVGLGIAAGAAVAGAAQVEHDHHATAEDGPQEDPFADPIDEDGPRPSTDHTGTYTPLETPLEDPVVATAQEVRMSQAYTPPLSPVHRTRPTSNVAEIVGQSEPEPATDVPPPVPPQDARRQTQPIPIPERRTGGLASLFKRGGTNSRKGSLAKTSISEASFSNTSRESMRNQPLPPHLIDTTARMPSMRKLSGTPTRTQSKFREDLPELPISPPDSRTASPDVTTAAAAAAAARRGHSVTQPIDIRARQSSTTTTGSEAISGTRYDTPISPSLQQGTSLASVDSEGAWLAGSSAKRASRQSGLGTRRPEFSNSYEELGTDTDAQHFSRGPGSPDTLRGAATQDENTPNLAASTPTSNLDFFDAPENPPATVRTSAIADDNSEAEETGTPTVHENTVRRRPTLVHGDPRFKSREGLLTHSYTGATEGGAGGEREREGEEEPTSATSAGRGSFDLDDLDSELGTPFSETMVVQRATSVRVQHGRHTSSGSAKLFDVPARN
ncbi:hypothetical protein BDY17DRAFT_296550 [Neohortaea acidophila]|uniref:Uncharacterized protein n=1 Tax=Neohortaea acidophila TaxID=245834 RepID=A0A6A6PUP6_9PEZI|nr:uncharacterized protein BDY17DRAFT_296550 [Neohortaea acidophila]KAF2482957.1 hypothetical protein BDY17DRAFT_296550 [Neohortaea acidophila]